jgi:tetratricopeptide (TPR) repeat protein
MVIFFCFNAVSFAQPVAVPWWLSLEQGKQNFRAGEYGAALILFEDARRDRRAMYEQMERDFITFLSINEVRRIGDSLDRVERYSYERRYTSASKALEELYYRIPKTTFNNSATSALAAFDRLKNYPEAEYWIGEVYRVEGEFPLALTQYRRAYSMRETLEDPGFSTTLQYKISAILRTRQEYVEMERLYLSIINELDTLWANASILEANNSSNGASTTPAPYAQASASFARSAMTRTLTEHGIDRFMELYRYNNGIVEQAHRLLGFYYAAQGRSAAEQHLMFSFLIQNTIIIDEVKRRRYDFTFSDLSALLREINRSELLISYINEVEYFKTIYYFGNSLYRNGKTSVARTLWEFLASQPQSGEWQNRAAMQLRNPRPEQVVEMP